MLSPPTRCLLVAILVLTRALGDPIPFPETRLPLAAVSELSSRLATHSQHAGLQEPAARLPLPGPSDIEAIKKVAQILITLGQQVIPAIIGETTASCDTSEDAVEESP